ncbi:unnamed protein product [Fraxinus pennsylvanica]|uniref:Uncharacterized protein n=1 Tax=Fraxinus pennsylvanica TaxID=56036 RepID=A0AAD2EEZ2_9LAMI|nr:unnamed protein product [Fraxinus pennsylvanica]
MEITPRAFNASGSIGGVPNALVCPKIGEFGIPCSTESTAKFHSKIESIVACPNDPDAFRLLGEAKYALKDYGGSIVAYKSSTMVSKTIEFEVFCGLANSLLAAKKPDELLTPKFNAEKQAEFNKGVEGATKFLLSKFSDL